MARWRFVPGHGHARTSFRSVDAWAREARAKSSACNPLPPSLDCGEELAFEECWAPTDSLQVELQSTREGPRGRADLIANHLVGSVGYIPDNWLRTSVSAQTGFLWSSACLRLTGAPSTHECWRQHGHVSATTMDKNVGI